MTLQESERHARGVGVAPPLPLADTVHEDLDPVIYPSLSLPLAAYAAAAGEAERLWMERQEEEVEYGVVEWKAGWHFVRLMKRRSELQKLTATQALKKVRIVVAEASKQSSSYRVFPDAAFNEVVGGFIPDDLDEFDAIFIRHWKAIRYIPGESAIDTAVRLAAQHPLCTHESADGSLPKYRRLVSIAGWLQYAQRGQNIMLPTRLLSRLLGVSPRSISTYIGLAIDEELLERVKSYPPSAKMADEYRFRVDRFKILTDGPL